MIETSELERCDQERRGRLFNFVGLAIFAVIGFILWVVDCLWILPWLLLILFVYHLAQHVYLFPVGGVGRITRLAKGVLGVITR